MVTRPLAPPQMDTASLSALMKEPKLFPKLYHFINFAILLVTIGPSIQNYAPQWYHSMTASIQHR